MKFIRFFHNLFRPNCTCRICLSPSDEMVDQLKQLLESERINTRIMINCMTDLLSPKSNESTQQVEQKPVAGNKNWNQVRIALEERDRRLAAEKNKAEELAKAATENKTTGPLTIEALEKELEVNNEVH